MSQAHILIVDDDPLFRSVLSGILHQAYTVSVAGSGSEGYYKALEQCPAVAVIDIRMPGWDGVQTLRSFRSHAALQQIPVMMLTSDASKGTVLAAIEAGADDYLVKDGFSKDDFLRKLQSLVQQSRAFKTHRGGASSIEFAGSGHPAGSADGMPRQNSNSQTDLQTLLDGWE